MPTIKDIAKMAGVAHGTVSNVLNGKGNVSVKKIKLVEEAAQKLGYQLNLQAKMLKEGKAKTVSVILPNITSEQYSSLYDGLFNALNDKGYGLTLYLTHDAQDLELQFVNKIATKRDSAVIIVSCLSSAQSYYQTLKTPKSNIIFVYRKPDLAERFISLDFEKAGSDIADQIIYKQYRRIGLFSNSDKNTHSSQFKNGLVEQFKRRNYPIEFEHIESLPDVSTYDLAFSFFTNQIKNFDTIVTSDIERANYIRNANYFGSLQACPPIYTLSGSHFFSGDDFQQYQMNYGMLSQQVVKMIEGEELDKIENQGFLHFPKLSISLSQNETINFLMIPSPSTDAMSKLLPHFKKVSGIDVNLIIKPFDEIYHLLSNLKSHPHIDIIRIDMAGLPWFSRSALKPLTALDINLVELFSHYSQQITKRFSYINNVPYAVPFDPSIQMLFYRRDLFNDPLIKRSYFEKYKQQLFIPTNFTEFKQISEFFNQKLNSESPIDFGSCVTLGNSEIIASEFLLRYYAQGGKIIVGTEIQLDKNIAFNTLIEFESFIQIAKTLEDNWWQASVKQFEQGNLAMLIVYMNLFSSLSHRNILSSIGYAPVPGNTPLFGGGSLAMSKYSHKDKAVAAFFNWFFSNSVNEQFALLGSFTARDNLFDNQKIMNGSPWFNIVEENYLNGIRENQVDNKQVDLRQVENIIGDHLLAWFKQKYSIENVIDSINQELKIKAKQLIN